MHDTEENWPEDAEAALRKARSETEQAGCGGCRHAHWAGSVRFPDAKNLEKREFRFGVAICAAGVHLGANSSEGLLKPVAYCTARNVEIAAAPRQRDVGPSVFPPTIGRPVSLRM